MFPFLVFSLFGCDLEFKGNPLDVDNDSDGFTEFEGDCDDSNPYTYPGAAELESLEDCMKDEDEDGYGDMYVSDFPHNDGLTGIDCDDNNSNTVNDMDCDGVITMEDCDDYDSTTINDMDCDGVLSEDDCDDFDVDSTMILEDNDCDGVLISDDCDDIDPTSTIKEEDVDCDGVLTADDCDDSDAQKPIGDADCDGVLSADDCDDSDVELLAQSEDLDCDGVLSEDDCDDDNFINIISKVVDTDCDGIDNATDFDDDGDGQCDADTVVTSGDISNDLDCDGVLSADDCDDSSATLLAQSGDLDCDGVLSEDDCDDSDTTNTNMCIELSSNIVIEMVRITGSDLIDPLGRYTLENSFYMMTTEVTQGMFREVLGYASYEDGDNYPADYVSWHMAAHFANVFSGIRGLEECYSCNGSGTSVTCNETINPNFCMGYSLPTEHEWELAARSGTTSNFWTGEGSDLGGTSTGSGYTCDVDVATVQDGVSNPPLSDYAWFCGNSNNQLHEVGTKLPNGFGLYDMHGNLWEWTADWYGCSYPDDGVWCEFGTSRVRLGGSFSDTPSTFSLSSRFFDTPTSQYYGYGFRLRKLVNP